MTSPYMTVEDRAALWYEESVYISIHLATMGYGLHVAIFAIVSYYTMERRSTISKWQAIFLFNLALFTVGTINIACSIRFNESAWIYERNYPGGPSRFLMQQQSRPVVTLGNSTTVVSAFLADGLLLYRVMLLWDYAWYIILFPTLLFIICIVLATLCTVQTAMPNAAYMVDPLPVWILLMLINVVLPGMIAFRILSMRRKIKKSLGDDHARPYTNVASLVIESALPFMILSIVLLVLFGKQSSAQDLFLPLLIQVQCMAPELIILRVILRRSWSNDRLAQGISSTPIRFATASRLLVSEMGARDVRVGPQVHGSVSLIPSDGFTTAGKPQSKEAKPFTGSVVTAV